MSESPPIGGLLQRPITDRESRESFALLIGATGFVFGAGVGLLFFWGRDAAISGPGSLGQLAAIVSALAVLVAVVGVSWRVRRLVTRAGGADAAIRGRRLHWFDIVAIAVAHGVIALLGWIGLSSLLEASFVDAVIYWFAAAMLTGVAVAVSVYFAFLSIIGITPMRLSLVLAAFMITGIFASMLSASDPHWWKLNLSSLGMTDDISALAFNLTLIVGGLIVTALAHYATSWLPADTDALERGRSSVRLLLILIGVFLALVGVFPVDNTFWIHTGVAIGMVVAFVILVIRLQTLVPSMPRVFVLLGYLFVAVIVVLGVFFAVGYYTLTAVELVAGVLVFSWVIVFLRNTGAADRGVTLES
jgi:hypothetical membrane protein